MNICVILKSLKKNCQVRISLIVSSQIKKNIGKEYKHFLKVWNAFEMKTMKDYHDFYLKFNILLLADIFEKFRNNSVRNFGLCPSYYLSAPALNWDAILNIKKLNLNLF